jgi:hypothetical protein
MVDGSTLPEDPSLLTTDKWWASRRRRYNVALVVAGLLAFICYAIVVDWCIRIEPSGDFEITLFTTAFQGVGYLFMMAIANVCYYLGPFSERVVRPTNVAVYRNTTFRLGFWFSVLLPFTIPTALAISCHVH